jgi:predicted DNA-binding transcriptional regulator AlpA
MKRIYIMDDNGVQEYIPVSSLNERHISLDSDINDNSPSEDSLLTIADLTKKFHVTRPTIYAWEKRGLLSRVPIGGRVLFDPKDIRTLIDSKKNI